MLPAFPAKSSNANKTASILPDIGEKISLALLNTLCSHIKEFYKPGANIIICSDGRVFNDLVNVSDQNVLSYAQGIKQIISDDHLINLSMFSLENYYPHLSYQEMRTSLTQEYAESLEDLKKRMKDDVRSMMQFNGIHRFIFEDNSSLLHSISKNKVRLLSKEIAYQVVQRSNAWSHLVDKVFPDAVRLSIHPQTCGSNKIGIAFLKADNEWATPWHRVVLFDGVEHRLVKKIDAEKLYAKPIYIKNQFSHYSL